MMNNLDYFRENKRCKALHDVPTSQHKSFLFILIALKVCNAIVFFPLEQSKKVKRTP